MVKKAQSGSGIRPVTIVLVLAGLVFLAIGIYYDTTAAGSLASFVPGHQAGSTHHHLKHGLVAFGLAVLCWLGAWMTSGRRASGSDAPEGSSEPRG